MAVNEIRVGDTGARLQLIVKDNGVLVPAANFLDVAGTWEMQTLARN